MCMALWSLTQEQRQNSMLAIRYEYLSTKTPSKKGLTVHTSPVLFSSLVNAQCFCFVSFDFSMVSANQYFRDCPTWHVVMASSSQSLTSDNYDVLWLRRKF